MTSPFLFTNQFPLLTALHPLLTLAAMAMVFSLTAVAMLLFVRKVLPSFQFVDHTEFGAIFSGSISAVFGFILAFVTIAVWQTHGAAAETVSKEASALFNIYRTLESYPPDIRDEARAKLKTYVKAVVDQEWPAMTHGDKELIATREELKDLHSFIVRFAPTSYGQLADRQEMLRLFSEYRELRRDRLESAEPSLDRTMWISLVASSVIFMLFSCLHPMGSLRISVTLIVMLSSSISFVFYILVMYSQAFVGSAAISAEPFVRLLDYHMK
jgi:Protein of unknown function (DUF4239)